MIIGFTGAAGSGKSTAANVLIEQRGAIAHTFARPLKEMLCVLLQVPYDKWEDPLWKETVIPTLGKSPRELAQTLGTDWGRDMVHPRIWVKAAMERVPDDDKLHVFTDVRFPNEAYEIRERGGVIIKTVRTGEAWTLTAHSNHISELGLEPHLVDYRIEAASGDLDWIRRLSLAYCDQLMKEEAA